MMCNAHHAGLDLKIKEGGNECSDVSLAVLRPYVFV